MNHIGPELHEDRPRVIAFGSGKGGTGKSTLCADIARALTRHDFRVLCVDMDLRCPSLNISLACGEPAFDFSSSHPGLGDPESHIADFIVATGYPDVYLASLAAGIRHPFTSTTLHADELMHQLHELDFDWVLLDLSPSIHPLDVGLFTLSDIPILVTSPEPAAVRLTTQFLRTVLFRAIGYHPEAASLEGEVLDMLYKQPLQLHTRELRYDAPSADSRAIIDDTLHRLETYMIVNLVREGAEHDLGFVFSHALYCELQLFPRVLKSLDYADRRWFYKRRRTGMDQSRTEDGLSNEIELLARNIRDISLVDQRYPRPIPNRGEAHPARLMGLNPELSRNEVRQYCRRLWEGYRRENAISLVFNNPERRMEIADELESLYRQVLTMPSESFTTGDVDQASKHYGSQRFAPPSQPRKRASTPQSIHESTSTPDPVHGGTDASPDRDEHSSSSGRTDSDDSSADEGTEPRQARIERDESETQPPASTPPPDSPGARIARLRREASMNLQELSSRTHIGLKYLAAIEEIDLEVLPRGVYLRGYLREIARVFGVDEGELMNDYFQYLDQL